MGRPDASALRSLLQRVYEDCHRGELIDPDPLLVVRAYARRADRELVGLFCSTLALGRARAIVDAARRCLAPFGAEPAAAIAELGPDRTRERLGIDAYRFFSRRDLASLLSGAVGLQVEFGSLEGAFISEPSPTDGPVGIPLPRAVYAGPSARLLERGDRFVDMVRAAARSMANAPDGSANGLARNLLPAPRDGSACKRLMLFLRWMVRRDEVDVGSWTSVSPSELVMPLDTHIHRIALALGLTSRATADLAAALDVTDALRAFDPADPVRFDFSLSRLGIRSDYSLKDYLDY